MNREELYEIIESVSGAKVNAMIEKQIDNFVQSGITYKEIARAVVYFYDVRKNDKNRISIYGIGIVKNIRNEANTYYDNLKLKTLQIENAAKRARLTEIETVNVKPQRRVFSKKGYDINEL